MKSTFLFLVLQAGVLFSALAQADLNQIQIRQLDGKPLQWSEYTGKTILFANIATQCGYTPQLAGLQKLSDAYKAKGLVVIGIPSNDFGGQTPEDAHGVQNFCRLNYGVTFPLTEKVKVKGEGKHALAQFLLAQAPTHEEIGWNFEKFVVSPTGKIVGRFKSAVTPEDGELKKSIEQNLPH